MSQSDGQIIIQVSLDDNDAKKGLTGIDKEFDKLDKSSKSKFSKIGSSIKGVGLAAAGVVGAVGGLGVAFGALAAPLVKAAAGAQAMNAQFEQVFGDLQKQAQTSVNTLGKNFGMIPERIKPAFTQMTSMFKGLGLDTNTAMAEAEKAVTAVADAAAFYDMSFNDANAALNSFIKGNYEGGEAIGLFANETQLASYAVKDGLIGATKEWANLDEATKQATRLEYALAMQNMAGATGQATRESDSLENQLGNLKQAWENLKALLGAPLLEPAIQGIKLLTEVVQNFDVAPFIAAFEIAMSYVSTAIDEIKTFVQNGLSTVASYFEENGTSIREIVQNAFNNAKSVIESVLNTVVPFVRNQLEKIRQFWSENGEQIMQAAKNAFEGIKAIIDFIMPAIQFVIEYVWEAITDIFSGAVDVILGIVKTFSSLFTGDWKGLWEGIKQILSGAVDLVMGIMSLSFLGGIRKIFADLLKTGVRYVKNMWDDIVLKFQGAKDKVIAKAQSLKDDFIKKLVELKDGAVGKAGELKDQFVKKVKEIDLLQIGKDIVNGLIKGLNSKVDDLVTAAAGLGNKIIGAAGKALKWNSPSKVFIGMGEDTGKGMVIGLKNTFRDVASASREMAEGSIDAATKALGIASPAKQTTIIQLNVAKEPQEINLAATG